MRGPFMSEGGKDNGDTLIGLYFSLLDFGTLIGYHRNGDTMSNSATVDVEELFSDDEHKRLAFAFRKYAIEYIVQHDSSDHELGYTEPNEDEQFNSDLQHPAVKCARNIGERIRNGGNLECRPDDGVDEIAVALRALDYMVLREIYNFEENDEFDVRSRKRIYEYADIRSVLKRSSIDYDDEEITVETDPV